MAGEAKEKIGETIRVLASFSEAKIRIHFFHWRDQIFKVDSVNLFHIEKDGNKKRYHFAVSAKGSDYQIAFDPVSLEWQLVDSVITPFRGWNLNVR
ncbi:MAG TPA: hypothetical protein VLE93_01805 [Candidatus Saccharimonadales bacterium]|nr:hypothetical protein [Candidatus Saccharimonadales bacterium]